MSGVRFQFMIELIPPPKKNVRAEVAAQAGNMSHLMQAEVAAIARGQANGVAAILADASMSDAEKAEAAA